MLFLCVDLDSIGVYDCGTNNVARVSCEIPNPDVKTASMLITSVMSCPNVNSFHNIKVFQYVCKTDSRTSFIEPLTNSNQNPAVPMDQVYQTFT